MLLSCRQRQFVRTGLLFAEALVFSLIISDVCAAAGKSGVEIKPFGLLDVDTSLVISYDLDSQENRSASGSLNSGSGETWIEKLYLITKSYVYHPAFLNIDFSLGPSLVQQHFDAGIGPENPRDTLVDFLARFNFLDIKNYPFSLYVERSHPTVATGLSWSYPTETDRYGFDWQIAMPEKAMTVALNYSNDNTEGEGFGSIIDEDVERGYVSVGKSYGRSGSVKLEQTAFERHSSSGSSSLPIQPSETRQRNTRVVARNGFGKADRLSIQQTYDRIRQITETTASSEFVNQSYIFSSRYEQSEDISLLARYRFFDSERTDSSSRNQGLNLGLTHSLNDNFRYNANADYIALDQTGFNRDELAVVGSATYSRPTRFGSIAFGANVRQARSDQDSASDTVSVFEESVVLEGTVPVDLRNEFVVESSVIVRNVAQTQVFIEGLDYRLLAVGSVTSIQRLINGNILDGQTVLVDYEYQTSGSAELETVGYGLNASAQFLRHFRARVTFSDSDTDVLSGQLTRPTNDRRRLEFAVRADLPIGFRWSFGGEFRHTDIDEEISPSVSQRIALTASTTIFGAIRLNLAGALDQVDNKTSQEDVDQVSLAIGISGRVFRGGRVRYDATYLEDDGGSLPRNQIQHRLNFDWQYRQTRFLLRALFSDDALGVTDRSHTRVTAEIARFF